MHRKQIEVDPRVQPLLQGSSPAQRFLIIGIACILAAGDKLTEVLEAVGGRGVDVQSPVHGKPLAHWMGKDAKALRKEAGEDGFKVICEAFANRGMTIEAADEPEEPESPELPNPQTPPEGITVPDPSKLTVTPVGEEELKIAGHPVSLLVGKSDTELRKFPGMGTAAIKKVREHQQKLEAEREQAAAAGQ